MIDKRLWDFIRESNKIEGIVREPTIDEIGSTHSFLLLPAMTADFVLELQAVYAPGKPLRVQPGMDVQVGDYVAPLGRPSIREALEELVAQANDPLADPWQVHVVFEALHPFMDGNGRTGRALWAWMMQRQGKDPFAIPFLHRWYYQTLENQHG